MKIAVMMAAYNAERHLESALASLLVQRDAAKLDIIVVNDGSNDGTGAILSRLSAEAPEIRVITQENKGITRTRNVLLDALAPDTDLVTTLDSDDLSPADRFARDRKPFEADPALEMAYGYMLVFRAQNGDDPRTPDFEGKTAKLRGIHLGAMLVRPSLLKKVGRFDEKFIQAEDTDYLLRLLEVGPQMSLSDEVSYIYRRHGSSLTSDKALVRREFARALMASSRRRRAGGVHAVPANFFDHEGFEETANWY